jgi:SAM-dependent methyltransferase
MNLGNALREMTPWWAKLGAKLVLSRLPVPYRVWKQLGLFEHGRIDSPTACLNNFETHLALAGFLSPDVGVVNRSLLREAREEDKGFTVLELGPGDSLGTALIAAALGAEHCYLADNGDYASRDVNSYKEMARHLVEQGYEFPSLKEIQSVDEILSVCNATYLTNGLASLRELPPDSVDFIFSNAVLEHVRRHELPELLGQTRRVLKPDGLCSHRIDLQDHLGGALNNLRFSEQVWESSLMAKSGFYTNRLRFSEMLAAFGEAGFAVEIGRTLRWTSPPTPRHKLEKRFQSVSEDDLLVYGFDAILRPR